MVLYEIVLSGIVFDCDCISIVIVGCNSLLDPTVRYSVVLQAKAAWGIE